MMTLQARAKADKKGNVTYMGKHRNLLQTYARKTRKRLAGVKRGQM